MTSKKSVPRDDVARVNFDGRRLEADGRMYRLMELKPKSTAYLDRFTIIFQQFCDEIVAQPLNIASFRLLFWSIGALSYKTFKPIYQQQIAAELEMSQPVISRAFNELVGRGWLERRRDGRTSLYRISSQSSWRGSAAGWHAHRNTLARGDERELAEPTSDQLNSAETKRHEREVRDLQRAVRQLSKERF